MRIDLHSHSTASDGTQSPTQVVRAAADAGLDVLALTDHDTDRGWAEAAEAAAEVGIELVPGIEVSTLHHGRSVHLLAYWPDPDHPPLRDALEEIRASRRARVPVMLALLAEHGIELSEDDVARASVGTSAPGRPHVADALVERGVVEHRGEALARYLQPGGPAWVPRTGIELVDAVRWIREAGGTSVVAHPWGRSARDVLGRDTFAALAAEGLAGIEVDHQDHSEQDRRDLRRLADELDLVVTGASDHHGRGKRGHALGCHTTHPEEYQRLRARARRLG
ncbi:PHP domain-containing protein [Nocardioides sp. Y6]|uniref:PHP domain-containing protein n=1 Tax=Nocardioides malaquae TaxID=2773426 RepID=A0ABR9RQP5_9ACTN|nr:PHP domain-containing protein [Nocardioides malaquae]